MANLEGEQPDLLDDPARNTCHPKHSKLVILPLLTNLPIGLGFFAHVLFRTLVVLACFSAKKGVMHSKWRTFTTLLTFHYIVGYFNPHLTG